MEKWERLLHGISNEDAKESEDFSDDDSEDEDIPSIAKENGKPDVKTEVAKAAIPKNDVKASGSEKQVNAADLKKTEEEDSVDDESHDEEDESGSDEDMLKVDSDSEDEESDSDEAGNRMMQSSQACTCDFAAERFRWWRPACTG